MMFYISMDEVKYNSARAHVGRKCGFLVQEVLVLHISGHKNDSVSIILQFTILWYAILVRNQ